MIATMAGLFTAAPINVTEVARFFVTQYYQILQQSPQVVYQFYVDASTVVRVEGDKETTASTIMDIHHLLSSLNFTSIEIKTVHALSSWYGGLLVMVSGFVQMKEYKGRREFVQTFFLAPQERGYYVLNDIFHLLDEERTLQASDTNLAHNYDNSSDATNQHVQDSVLGYTVAEEVQTRDYVSPVNVLEDELQTREYVAPLHSNEIDTVDKYSIPEPQYNIPEPQYSMPETQYNISEPQYDMPEPQYDMPEPQYSLPEPQQISQMDDNLEEIPAEEPVSFPAAVTMVRDPPVSAEPIGERPKQTYASILRLAKGQPGNSMPRNAPVSKVTPVVPDAQLVTPQQPYPATSMQPENSGSDVVEDFTTAEDEGEVKSVYVGNLSSSVSASDLEHEFKNFGRLKPNGVTVRSRKDSGGFYAFVEFEDAASVQTALQASPIVVNGRQIYVEERKPNSGISRVGGGRRGRGRGGYQSDAPRGRFGGRGYNRSAGNDYSNDREYNGGRSRGNGVFQRVPRQERGILGNHAARNGQNPSEAAY